MTSLALSLNQLVPSKCNMRSIETSDDVSELVSSIKSQGILNPLLVRPLHHAQARSSEAKYEVYAGHRRLLAARELKLTSVPCLVSELSDIEAQVRSLVENYQRLEPGYYEKISTFQRLYLDLGEFDTTGVTVGNGCLNTTFEAGRVNSLCSLVGVKPKTLKRYLRLAALPKEVLRKLDRSNSSDESEAENKSKAYLTLKNAELLLTVPQDFQVELVEAMIMSELSGSEMEMVIRAFIKTPKCEMIPEFINAALEKSQQNRRQKVATTDNGAEAVDSDNVCEQEVDNNDPVVEPSSEEQLPPGDPGEENQVNEASSPVSEEVEEDAKVSKKNPWLYDPKDKRHKPRAIPPEQMETFWDLYLKLNPVEC